MATFQNTTEFKKNLEFDPTTLQSQGWREVNLVSTVLEKVVFTIGATASVMLLGLAVGILFFFWFGSGLLTHLEPMYLVLFFVGVLLHELVHVLFFPRGTGKGDFIIALCRGTMSAIVLYPTELSRRDLILNLLAPLLILSIGLFGISILVPQFAGHFFLLAYGNAAWAGVDVAVACLIFRKVDINKRIHLSSIGRLSVFLR
jgi:Putative zincin peptidase